MLKIVLVYCCFRKHHFLQVSMKKIHIKWLLYTNFIVKT
jgi:hypothetical protein